MLKITFLFNSYVGGMAGGDKRFIEIVKRIRNCEKYFLTSETGKYLCQINSLSINKYFITTKEKKINSVYLTYLKRTIKSISIDFNNTDMIYSTSDFLPDTVPAFIYKCRKNVKWIGVLHLIAPNPLFGSHQYYLKDKKIKIPTFNAIFYKLTQLLAIKLMRWKADKIFVVNPDIKEYLITKNINKNKIIIVDNGVDFAKIQKMTPFENIKYDAAFIGRFHPQKGIFDLIKIWALICKQNNNVKLAIIGDGTEEFRAKVKNEIKKANLNENIDLLGFLSETEKIKVVKSSKIFVCPSFYESWGIVITEAMACGLPVVVYDLPIYNDIYEENILKVQIGNINQFAETILELLDNEVLRNNFGFRGQKFIQKYDWEKIVERELYILKKI